MKGFTFGFLVALTALPAMAATGVSRIIPGTDTATKPTVDSELRANTNNSNNTDKSTGVASRTTASRAATTSDITSRVSATSESGTRVAATPNTTTSGVASRVIGSDGASRTSTTRTVARSVSAETGVDGTRVANRSASISRSQTDTDARSTLESVLHNSGRSARTDAAGINANPAVRRMGLTLRPSTAEVGGRAIMESGAQTGSNIASEINNMKSSRAATVKSRDSETKLDPVAIAEAKDRLEQTAALNKSCQEQYNDCMDQFCAVIDSNQKRCSCSANLSKYAKVEQAVKDANAELNAVAQNIRYVGLSADEISAIMSATEAEEAMTGTTDTTENRNMLAQIEKMIKDPTTTTSSTSFATDSFGLLDIDLDFSSSDLSDLFSLDFLSGNSGNSFSSLRGSDLYNAAKKRCNTVITQCGDVGATSQQITGNYDLAIDKDCIAYEQGLTKMNEALVSNVRSANLMLQKARLAVLQNQNTYNARECIGALETCMTDEMVCGEDYKKCLDPTKMYIDENGNVVLGQNINVIQNFMSDYNNADINQSFLSTAASNTTINNSCEPDGSCVVKYLLTKIGTGQKATESGLCRPVLDKCRAYTYDTRGNYIEYNDIVINYIQRAMVNIKAAQYQIVSDYASTCLNDIASCYNNQVSQLTSWSATAAASSVYNIMRGACRNVALTCGYAVFSSDTTRCPTDRPDKCIQNISEIFYQSLLCPDNSVYVGGNHAISQNNKPSGYVNAICKCNTGFVTFNGACLPTCDNGGQYLSSGVCSTVNCPANSSEATGNEIDFWGHCKCNSNYHWFQGLQACEVCPSNSDYNASAVQTTKGSISYYNYQCVCKTDDKYFAYGTGCKKCPSGIEFNTNYTQTSGTFANGGPCHCPDGTLYYCPGQDSCVENEIACTLHSDSNIMDIYDNEI